MICAALMLPAGVALAQAPAAPTPEAQALARKLVTVIGGDRTAVLAAMTTPLIGLMKQMANTQSDRAAILVHDVLMPVLSEHYDELLNNQAKAYLALLSVSDIKAILAFYNTEAGQHLSAARPKLAQATMSGVVQWIAVLKPEIMQRTHDTMMAHGWTRG
jgi:hypothetical protein